MQTQAGDAAKGMTSKEFEKVMGRIMDKLRMHAKANPRNFHKGVTVVMDNARFHSKEMKKLGKQALEIPPLSPEFNKPVEHMFNTIKTEFWKRYAQLLAHGGAHRYVPFNRAKELLQAVVEEMVKPAGIAKDVKSLRKTYEAVIAAKGSYISTRVS